MNTYIGIDLGTSSSKLLLVSSEGKILNSVTREYPIYYPHSGWSEQNPEDWYNEILIGLKTLLRGQDKSAVKGIGFGGQMHGLVLLDKDNNVIRPAILWNDGRTQEQTDYLNDAVGKKRLSELTANIAFAGFTAPKILWVKEKEPENFKKIAKFMLPKDYMVFRLTGVHSTDYSDSSGTLLLDVKNKKWSEEMLQICSVERSWLPQLFESYEPVGNLLPQIASDLDLSPSVVVAAGAGDNAAAAVGTGTIANGACNISLGTSGTVFISSDDFSVDANNALHSFCHANGKYHLMGCILSAASCNKWWMEEILNTKEYFKEQIGFEDYAGHNDVFFLPYLMGERSPHNDVYARGVFIGMRPDTARIQMTLAVMEGVAFALKDCVEVAKKNGVKIDSSRICGGGAKSKVWKQVIADILGIPINTLAIEEGPAYGGAILAMAAYGEYTLSDAVEKLIKFDETIAPDEKRSKCYQERYEIYKKLYPSLKNVFREFN